MGCRVFVCAVSCGALLLLSTNSTAVTPRRDGGPAPESLNRVTKRDATAFTARHAWAQKARRIREARREFEIRHGNAALQANSFGQFAVTGTLRVPVLPGYFSGASAPVTTATLQNQLFDSNPTGTIGQYYSEVSYGQFTVDGDVFAWVPLAYNNPYYAGSSNGTDPLYARIGELILELLTARDGTVDFGQYDNDGPDGVPNSGDDDGFVDLLCVLHNLPGYECAPQGATAANIQSHTWSYSAWPTSGGNPYITNDPAFNGGFIQVEDYTIAPAVSCDTGVIEIGVFCHEFGHGLGLPDLYDRRIGGTWGIGYWGLMGAGSWNTPDVPAHPMGWTRAELGWAIPTQVSWEATAVTVPNIEQNATLFRLPFTDDRFRRSTSCVIAGSYSLYCGLTEAEATTRRYVSPGPGGGYGPNWYETVERDFSYDGTGPVALQYKVKYDMEPDYDFGYAIIEVNGTESPLAFYSGTASTTANHDLTAYLAPLAGSGGTYTLKFRVISDMSFDDADGWEPSACGAMAVDDLSVSGGGETYTTGFETHIDGWHQDPAENPAGEYWLVENRARLGGDVNLPGEGLMITHVDDELLHAPFLWNDGANGAVRGLVVEEGDGQFNLLQNRGTAGSNPGDAGDAFPGSSNNVLFGSLSNPSSTDNTQRATRIEVSNIGPAGTTMSATLRAGDRGPVANAVAPASIDNDQVAVPVEIAGLRLAPGSTVLFRLGGGLAPSGTYDSQDIVPSSLQWVDADLIRATLNVYSKTAGPWDLIVTNPDGQSFTLGGAITINHIVATQLRSATIDLVTEGVRLRYELVSREAGEVVRLYRSTEADGGWRLIADDLQPVVADTYEFVDSGIESGHTYYYLLEAQLPGEAPRELHRGTAVVPARDLVLEQNVPNPFNPRTSIRFFLPQRGDVQLNVYDVRGGLVRRLAMGVFDAGAHSVSWDGTDDTGSPVVSGMYVYRIAAGQYVQARKMMLLK